MIKRDGAGAEENQSKGEGAGGEGKFVSWPIGRSQETIVPVDFPNGDRQVDADGEGGGAGEESGQNQQATEKLGEGRDVAQPAGQAHAGHELREMMQAAENLVISVGDHNRAQCEAHDEKGKGLQTVEIAQIVLRAQ